VNKLK